MALRLGVDLGGTKIEIAVFDESGREILRRRAPRHAPAMTSRSRTSQDSFLMQKKKQGSPA
jgi:predicted NBD/HSP70 family sugar kinase